MLFLISLLLVCIGVGLWLLVRNGNRQPPLHPGGPIGNAYVMGLQYATLWEKVKLMCEECNRSGGITRFMPIINSYYLVTDLEAVMNVLKTNLSKGHFQKFWHLWLENGLANAPVSMWKVHRKLQNPMFSQRVLDECLVTFNEQARRLVQEWEQCVGQEIDPLASLDIVNSETIFLITFGFTEDRKTLQEFCRTVNEINIIAEYRFQRFWLHYDVVYNWTNTKRREKQAVDFVHELSSKLINKRKSILNKNKQTGNGIEQRDSCLFLDMLLKLQEENYLTERQVRSEIDSYLFAGHHSVSVTLVYTLVLLGSFPAVQDKVYAELQDRLETQDVRKKDLSGLVYLEAVIKESLRLYPYAPFVARTLDKDVKLKNCTLSAGTNVFALLYGTYRDPGLWGPDADEFRPERWLDHTLPDNPVPFVGFSWGKRSCIGKPYAMMLMKTSLSHLLRNFKFTADHTQLKMELYAVLKPLSGHHITFEKR